jgi:tetratricopeptide (TPR) repeat protein
MRSALSPGEVLGWGRYALEEVLGRGGFGEVWRAWDRALGCWVALKVLAQEAGGEEAERFEREILALARLEHPHIVELLDEGWDERLGVRFFTMALAPGRPWDEVFGLDELVAQLDQVLSALGYAHARGIVHRDLKPGNILVSGAWAQVLDFGIMRIAGGHASEMDPEGTRVQHIGTLAYMSPEQAAGESMAVGPASDLYTLGVVLYEILTGAVPFQGGGVAACFQHMMEPPPPLVVRPALQGRGVEVLEGLVAVLLAKPYAARPESAAEVRSRLAPLLREGAAAARPPVVMEAALASWEEEAPAPTVRLGDTEAGATQGGGLGVSPVEGGMGSWRLPFWRPPVLVGRGAAQAELRGWSGRVLGGGAAAAEAAVLCGGEGMGKSALVQALAGQLLEAGAARVLHVSLEEHEDLWVGVHEALYRLLRLPRLEYAPLKRRVEEALALKDASVVECVVRFMLARPSWSARATPEGAAWEAAIASVLVRVALWPHPRPLLLVVDGGGGWVSASLARWWSQLRSAFQAAGARLLWSWAPRGELDAAEVVRWSGVEAARLIAVSPLALPHVESATQALVPGLSPAACAQVYRVVQGNPRYLRELLLGWCATGALQRTEEGLEVRAEARDQLPRSLREAWERRLGALVQRKPGASRALAQLALLGAPLSEGLVRAALEGSELKAEALQQEGWLREAAAGRGPRWLFGEAAARQAALGPFQGEARLELTRSCVELRLGAVLAAVTQSDWEDALAGLQRVLELLETAGLLQSGLHGEALHLLGVVRYRQRERLGLLEAVALLEAAEEGKAGQRWSWRGGAALWRGAALLLEGSDEAAGGCFEAALSVCESGLVGGTATLFLGERALGQRALATARRLLEEASRRLRAASQAKEGSAPMRRLLRLTEADAARNLAELRGLQGEHAVATALLLRVRQLYAEQEDLHGEAYTFIQLTRLYRRRLEAGGALDADDASAMQRSLGRAKALMQQLDDRRGHALLAWELAGVAEASEGWGEAALRYEEARQLFEIVGDAFSASLCANSRGECLRRMGRLEEALACYMSFYAAVRDLQHEVGIGLALSNIAWTHLALGNLDAAEYFFEEALRYVGEEALLWERAAPRLAQSCIAVLRGDEARAVALLREVVACVGQATAGDRDVRAAIKLLRSSAAALGWVEAARLVGELR